MAWLVVITLVSLVHLQSVSSIFLPYWKAKNHTENSFHIPLNALAVDADVAKFGKKLSSLQNITKEHSLDERCETGLPMSIAWHQYAPYVTMFNSIHEKKVGFTVEGMFPAILTQVSIQRQSAVTNDYLLAVWTFVAFFSGCGFLLVSDPLLALFSDPHPIISRLSPT